MKEVPDQPVSHPVTGLLLPVIAGIMVSLLCLSLLPDSNERSFDDLALGKETTSVFATVGDYPIHCEYPGVGNKCIEGVRARGADRLVLWLGNSQVHAINQFKSGDENAPPMLFRKLQKHGVDLVVFSQPNANLEEHYVLFEYLRRRMDIDLLILPLVFDDMRETGLRAEILNALDDDFLKVLEQSPVGRRIVSESKGVLAADDFAGLENTVQDHTERRINEWLEGNVALWKKRPALRGHLLNTLYRLRNFVFGITPSTTRRVIKGRYELNRRALVQLLETAMENNIKVVVYITPLRMDVEIPYDRAEYDAFKKDMSGLVVSFGQSIHNHEGLVPGVFWGRKAATTVGGGAEIDFMHFQAGGHRLLADALYADVVDRL